jgi:hypothetical protein
MATNSLGHTVGIDCETKGKNEIIRRLRALASAHTVEDRGAYHEAPGCSMIYVTTLWTESEVEDWLYGNNLDYLGTFDPKIHDDEAVQNGN